MNKLLTDLKKEAKAMASALPVPVFYRDLETQIEFARDMFFFRFWTTVSTFTSDSSACQQSKSVTMAMAA